MDEYVKRSDVINYVCQFCKDQHADELCDQWDVCQLFTRISNVPSADVVERDEGIKIGAALAAMHGSDATSQDLEKAYFKGMEEGYKKGRSGFEKRGRILTNEFGYESCSVCHYGLTLFITDENNVLRKPNYCPNCGVNIRENNLPDMCEDCDYETCTIEKIGLCEKARMDGE